MATVYADLVFFCVELIAPYRSTPSLSEKIGSLENVSSAINVLDSISPFQQSAQSLD